MIVAQLPPPDTIARMLGGIKVGGNDWRLPHICGGEHSRLGQNPGLRVRSIDGKTQVRCFYGCKAADSYAAVKAALGISDTNSTWNPANSWIAPPTPAGPPPTQATLDTAILSPAGRLATDTRHRAAAAATPAERPGYI